MNMREFIKSILGRIGRSWAVLFMDICMDITEEKSLILDSRVARADSTWGVWVKERKNEAWRPVALCTLSILASQCESRPEAMYLYAREAYKIALEMGWSQIERDHIAEIKAGEHGDATEQQLAVRLSNKRQHFKARLDKLVDKCKG